MAGKRIKTGFELASVLTEIGEELEENLDEVIQKLTLEGFRELTRRTPVRTGFLKSRWTVTIFDNVPDNTIKNPGGSFPPPNTPSERMFKWGDHVRIYNNVEYAEYIENGTQRMRAQPMIQPTYMYLNGIANRLLNAISKKKIP